MKEQLDKLKQLSAEKAKENKKYLDKLAKKPPKNLDYTMQSIHDQVFDRIDCLQCANCCKTTGPLVTDNDVVRISKHLKLKPQSFIEQYLRVDEDNDLVFQSMPCPFLGADNYCSIYEVRPKACREFPHTDRKKFHQIRKITIKNTEICPATYEVMEALKKEIKL